MKVISFSQVYSQVRDVSYKDCLSTKFYLARVYLATCFATFTQRCALKLKRSFHKDFQKDFELKDKQIKQATTLKTNS